jgi:predicted transcriptional regulator
MKPEEHKRRSKIEVYVDALDAINNKTGITTTTLLNEVNTGFKPLKDILNRMESSGLIETDGEQSRKHFYITERGTEILYYLSKGMKFMNSVDPEVYAPNHTNDSGVRQNPVLRTRDIFKEAKGCPHIMELVELACNKDNEYFQDSKIPETLCKKDYKKCTKL